MIDLKRILLAGTSAASLAMLVVPASAQSKNGAGEETVIVTGTRVQGMKAADSAAPVMVLGADALKQGTGSTDLRDAVAQMVPSFTAQQRGGDLGNMTLSAALRGLSPNDTLVLVNGHRRHGTANIQVSANGFTGGSSSPDLSLIPQNAIDHVEVLLDGAAAQYGTDAIGGVVNIILKKKSSGGIFEADAGNMMPGTGRAMMCRSIWACPCSTRGLPTLRSTRSSTAGRNGPAPIAGCRRQPAPPCPQAPLVPLAL